MNDARQPVGPQPEPLRFFGTTWVNHDGNYGLRRAGVVVGSLCATAAGALVLGFGYQGLAIAAVSGFVSTLVVVVFAACSAIAFRRTWEDFARRPGSIQDASVERSMQSIRMIGFIGVLLAWFVRSLVEAPGEKLHRAEYEREREQYERRRASRAGNPAVRGAGKTPVARNRKRH
jgi:hypothetical protein